MVIRKIAPLPAARIVAVVYMAISVPFAIFFWLVGLVTRASNLLNGSPFSGLSLTEGTLMSVILPFIYGVVGFIMTLLGAWLYNVVAGWVGGIEIDVQTQP